MTCQRFIVLLFLFVCNITLVNGKELALDTTQRALIAPEGQAYQWYHNNERIEGARSQALEIKASGQYTVEVMDSDGELLKLTATVAVTATGAVIRIYTIGDSTVSTYDASLYPRTGWGQVLQSFFNSTNVQVINKAVSGTSSKSFYNTYWTAVKNALVAGDYVFIQFGHNDSKNSTQDDIDNRYTDPSTTYKQYLTNYINETKAKGAIPILVTSMNRNYWKNGVIDPLPDYPPAMRALATALNIPLIDLTDRSASLFNSLGQAYTTSFIFNNLAVGEYPNYPDGNSDNTHFQEMGALDMARLVVEGITDLKSIASLATLYQYLKPQYKVSISVNPTGSDQMTTRTATYPQGVTITLKTYPKTTSTFQKWNNASNTSIATTTLTTVSAGAAATSYTAIYKGAVIGTYDCNNTLNGTATLDVCGRCIAGTTGKTACTTVGEAETDACAFDGITETKNTGYKGTSYLNVDNAVGTAITFNVTATNAGTATLSFRYANGGALDRPAQISLNGTVLANNLSLPVTGTFTDWKVVDLSLTLVKGINVVKLISSTAEGLANIDQIGYVSAGVSSGSCIITSIEASGMEQPVSIYPNPSREGFQVSLVTAANMQVFDMEGGLREEHKNVREFEFVKNLKAGIYFLKIDAKVYKLIKE